MRFIETEPYRGARVRQVTREELTETYPVRAALEELAGGMAGPIVDDSMLRHARDRDPEHARGRTQARTSTACSSTTHGSTRSSSKAAGNTVLLDSWSGLRIEAYTLVSMIKSHLDLVAIANAHLPILDALRQRDGSLAGKVMREHIEHFGSSLLGDEPDE